MFINGINGLDAIRGVRWVWNQKSLEPPYQANRPGPSCNSSRIRFFGRGGKFAPPGGSEVAEPTMPEIPRHERVLVGLALPYGPTVPAPRNGRWPPGHRWRFMPGCAMPAIRHEAIRMVENHEWDAPIIATTGDPALAVWDAPEGLMFALTPVTTWQQEVLRRAHGGGYRGVSCGFLERTSLGHEANGLSTFTELALKEISLITVEPPAFSQTWVRVMSVGNRYRLEEDAWATVQMLTDRTVWIAGELRVLAAAQAYRVPVFTARLLLAGGVARPAVARAHQVQDLAIDAPHPSRIGDRCAMRHERFHAGATSPASRNGDALSVLTSVLVR